MYLSFLGRGRVPRRETAVGRAVLRVWVPLVALQSPDAILRGHVLAPDTHAAGDALAIGFVLHWRVAERVVAARSAPYGPAAGDESLADFAPLVDSTPVGFAPPVDSLRAVLVRSGVHFGWPAYYCFLRACWAVSRGQARAGGLVPRYGLPWEPAGAQVAVLVLIVVRALIARIHLPRSENDI